MKRTLFSLFYMAVTYFATKKIVISKKHPPGEFKALIIKDGKNFFRTAWHQHKVNGKIPMKDIPAIEVLRLEEHASPFRKWVCSFFGIKPKVKVARFAGGKHSPTSSNKYSSPVKKKR
jgi:hypothetical protein